MKTWIYRFGMFGVVIGLALAAVAFSTYPTFARDEVKAPPPLTETQRLQVQNMLQRIQIAQLQVQAAQREFETTRADAQKLFTSLAVDGYELDLQTYQYVKKEKK